MEAAQSILKELSHLSELAASLKVRINMIATTPAEQRAKDRDLQVWVVRIDEAVTRAIRANQKQ